MNLASRLILASNWLYIAGLAPGSERNSSKLKLLQRSISLLMWYFSSASYDLLRMFSLSNWSERLVNFSASSFNSWKAWLTLPKIPLNLVKVVVGQADHALDHVAVIGDPVSIAGRVKP